jgi:CheY-like chemotaxis protein
MAALLGSNPAIVTVDQDDAPGRDPLETWPDFGDLDRRQADVLRAEERRRANGQTNRLPSLALVGQPVLIVEDDEDIRECLTNVLQDEGFETLTARNGQEALEILRREGTSPVVILLDLMMPVMNGWEFRQRLDVDDSIAHAPIIVMSALAPDDGLHSDAWLQKPLAVEQLLSTIARVANA